MTPSNNAVPDWPEERENHLGHWVDNLYCRVCKQDLTKEECFDMGMSYGIKESKEAFISWQQKQPKWLSVEEIEKIIFNIADKHNDVPGLRIRSCNILAEAIHKAMGGGNE